MQPSGIQPSFDPAVVGGTHPARLKGVGAVQPRPAAISRTDRTAALAAILAGIAPPHTELIEIDRLTPYPSYGRDVNVARLAHLRAGWCASMIGNLFVAHDPVSDAYTVIDGSHRWTIAKEKGTPPLIPCSVFEGLSDVQQAAAYDALNDAAVQKTRDIFKVRLGWRDPVVVSIDRTVRDAGYQLSFGTAATRTARVIQCFGALESIWLSFGQTHLFKTLTFIRSVFGEDRRAVRDFSVRAVSNILKAYPARLDEGRLRSRLVEEGFNRVLGEAHNRQLEAPYPSMPIAFTDAMVGLYNAKVPRQSANHLDPFRGRIPTMEPPSTRARPRSGGRGAVWNAQIAEVDGRPS